MKQKKHFAASSKMSVESTPKILDGKQFKLLIVLGQKLSLKASHEVWTIIIVCLKPPISKVSLNNNISLKKHTCWIWQMLFIRHLQNKITWLYRIQLKETLLQYCITILFRHVRLTWKADIIQRNAQDRLHDFSPTAQSESNSHAIIARRWLNKINTTH